MPSFDRGPRRPALALAGCALAALLAPAQADEPKLAGAAASARLVGNTVSGATPDGPYLERFAADGTLVVVDRDGKAAGRWSLKGDRLCTVTDDDEEECRAVEVQGLTGAFTDDGGARYPFTILPGNPKDL